MTKEQNEFLRMTKPMKFRTAVRMKMGFDRAVEAFVDSIARCMCRIGGFLGIYKHVQDRHTETMEKSTLENVEVESEYLSFNVQINKFTIRDIDKDYYENLKGEKVYVSSDSDRTRAEYYSFPAFPVRLNVGDWGEVQVSEETQLVGMPYLGGMPVGSYKKGVMYNFKIHEFHKVTSKRVVDSYGDMNDAEREDMDRKVREDFRNHWNQYMQNFPITEFLTESRA